MGNHNSLGLEDRGGAHSTDDKEDFVGCVCEGDDHDDEEDEFGIISQTVLEGIVVEGVVAAGAVAALLIAAAVDGALRGADLSAGIVVEVVPLVDEESKKDKADDEEEGGIGDGDAEEALASGLVVEGGVHQRSVLELGEWHIFVVDYYNLGIYGLNI